MANIVVRLPWPNISDPTQAATVTLVDQGDGTFAPKIASAGLSAYIPQGGPLTADLDAGGHEVLNAANLATLLADPGNVWEAETVYAAGDRIVVNTSVVMESPGHTSGLIEPTWPEDGTILAGVSDNGSTWAYIGVLNEVPYATMQNALLLANLVSLSQQTVPQTLPTVQDVIDALVAAFGLVQSD